jgi:hypothetical protein
MVLAFLQRNGPNHDRAGPHHFAGRTGELQRKFNEIKRSINNALAVMMALSEMPHRRPDYAEKLATTVTTVSTKAPQIVSSLQEVHAGAERKSWSQDGSRGRRESVAQSRDSGLFPKSSGCAERLVLELIHERH